MVSAAAFAILILPTAAAGPPAEDCIPCQPAPPIVILDAETVTDITFGDEDSIRIDGTVTYLVNVTGDGWFFDPTERPRITFDVPRGHDWVEASVDPAEIVVPIDDPSYLQEDGPYRYTEDVVFHFELVRIPTGEELFEALRDDGQYRVLVAAMSSSSLLGSGPVEPAGMMHGYGVQDFRFALEDAWEPIDPHAPPPAARLAGQATPGLGPWFVVTFLAAAAAIINRNSKKPL